jgi:uncharacterized protein (DUF2236 family)
MEISVEGLAIELYENLTNGQLSIVKALIENLYPNILQAVINHEFFSSNSQVFLRILIKT